MEIDNYDSRKFDNLRDDILGLIHADGCKERIPDICTVLRNAQDTLVQDEDEEYERWFKDEVNKRVEEEKKKGERGWQQNNWWRSKGRSLFGPKCRGPVRVGSLAP
jgi:hypothetical protein